MTSTQPLPDNLEAALATIVTRLNNIDQNILGLNNRLDRATQECPVHRTQTAVNTEAIRALEGRVTTIKTDSDKQIASLWARLWQVAIGAAGTGAGVTLLVTKLMGG